MQRKLVLAPKLESRKQVDLCHAFDKASSSLQIVFDDRLYTFSESLLTLVVKQLELFDF